MPILIATAAGAAATYGAYKGGKGAIAEAKRKRECRKAMREQRAEHDNEFAARQEAAAERKNEAAELSVQERLERFKSNMPDNNQTKKKGLLGRLRK